MKRVRALAARVLRVCRGALAAGPVRARSARLPAAAREQRHAVVVWIEDRAEQLILTTLAILIAAIGTLLLWTPVHVISLAREFQPVLGVIASLTAISLAVLNVLKGRRDRRREAEGRQRSPVPAVTTVPAAREPGQAPEPEGAGSSPPTGKDARGSSA
jgi:hypothetical protein